MKTSLTPRISRTRSAICDAVSVAGVQVRSAHLHVDGRRQTQVQHRVRQTAGLEVRAQLRHLRSISSAHAVHVLVAARAVTFLRDSPARKPCAARSCWCRSTRSPASRRCSTGSRRDPLRATNLRISSSTLATSSSVTSSRVPDCALRLITNWPASVRGKNAICKLRVKQQAGGE